MEVKVLVATVYDKTGSHYHHEETPNPTWPQIEASIRALDRFERPMACLQLYEDTAECGYLTVLGGEGLWAVTAVLDDYIPLNYFDESKSDEEIDVWISDQGFYPEEKYVCYDLDLVLRVAHHFAQFGQLSPAVTWQ